jgi:hypothetical protein
VSFTASGNPVDPFVRGCGIESKPQPNVALAIALPREGQAVRPFAAGQAGRRFVIAQVAREPLRRDRPRAVQKSERRGGGDGGGD